MESKIKDIVLLIVAIMFIYLTKSFIYYFPDIKQIAEIYNYDLVTDKLEVTEIKNIGISVKEKNNTKIFFLGRASCPDCRKVVRRVKASKEKMKLDLKYVNMEERIGEKELKYLQEDLKIDSIPSIVLISGGKVKIFDYFDIMGMNYEEKIKGQI